MILNVYEEQRGSAENTSHHLQKHHITQSLRATTAQPLGSLRTIYRKEENMHLSGSSEM